MLARELEKNELAPSKRNYADTIKSYLLEHYRELHRNRSISKTNPSLSELCTASSKSVYGLSPIRYMHQPRRAGSLQSVSFIRHDHRSYRPLFGLL